MELSAILRGDGFIVETDICGRGLKAQMKYAGKSGAKFSMVLGDNEIQNDEANIKNMLSGEETTLKLSNISNQLFDVINSSALDALAEAIINN